VRLGERPTRLAQEHDDALGRLRPETRADLLQIESIEKLHHVVKAAGVVHAEIVQLHGVRRPQPRSDLRFTLETPHQLVARCA
jgi:hypothetical protein